MGGYYYTVIITITAALYDVITNGTLYRIHAGAVRPGHYSSPQSKEDK